jgi:hypothetical protein
MELNKRQREIHELRRQASENRRPLATKTEVLSFMKTLQIKDNRLADEIEVSFFCGKNKIIFFNAITINVFLISSRMNLKSI